MRISLCEGETEGQRRVAFLHKVDEIIRQRNCFKFNEDTDIYVVKDIIEQTYFLKKK